MLKDFDPNRIEDPEMRQQALALLNLTESHIEQIRLLKEQVQLLRDEIARLKGQQGKPNIKPSKPAVDHSSEAQRRMPTVWQKRSKRDFLPITRTCNVAMDRSTLPADAEFKGYEEFIGQELKLVWENVRFLREKFYSPSTNKTYLAPLPEGYDSHFGSGIQSLSLWLGYAGNMSQAAIHALLTCAGVSISTGTVNRFLVQEQDLFHKESQEVLLAGLSCAPWANIDDTATRVNGKNEHCHVLGNPLFTFYHTAPRKDRQAVLSALCGGKALTYLCNSAALAYMQVQSLSKADRKSLLQLPQDTLMSAEVLGDFLSPLLPHLKPKQITTIQEGMAIAAYQAQEEFPALQLLVCDAAGQFVWLTYERALCWIHDGRHYAKLMPRLAPHAKLLEEFQEDYWDFYKELLAYREAPSAAEALRLESAFDKLFATVSGYDALDDRIQKSRAHKEELLMVLVHPEIPLHNNAAELAARRRVRKRDVSFGPRSEEGKNCWDTFMTLSATAAKLGVNFYDYLTDRLSKAGKIPPLAALIHERAAQLNLGASWEAA
jgi:Transposase IS66 family